MSKVRAQVAFAAANGERTVRLRVIRARWLALILAAKIHVPRLGKFGSKLLVALRSVSCLTLVRFLSLSVLAGWSSGCALSNYGLSHEELPVFPPAQAEEGCRGFAIAMTDDIDDAAEDQDGDIAEQLGALIGAGIRERQARAKVYDACIEKSLTAAGELD